MPRNSRKPACQNQAYRYLARRAHSVYELTEKLKAKGFDADSISETIGKLLGIGYLNDAKYCRAFSSARVEKMRLGPKRLKIDLGRKGFNDELIAESIEKIFGDDGNELSFAFAAAVKKIKIMKTGLDKITMKQKLFDHLVRRGFSIDVARRISLDRFDDAERITK